MNIYNFFYLFICVLSICSCGSEPTSTLDDLSSEFSEGVKFAQFDAKAKKTINNEYLSVKHFWENRQSIVEELTVLERKDLLISYNNRWGVMSICTPDILMIDLDYHDKEVGNRPHAVALLTEYAKKNHVTFAIRDSDRGMHAFLVSRASNPSSEESMKIMWELFGDRRYIAYSKIRGYCARIGPKIFTVQRVGPGTTLLSRKEMEQEFISKKPSVGALIGDPNAVLDRLIKKVELNDDLVKLLKSQFVDHYPEMTSATVNGIVGLIPNSYIENTLIPAFNVILNKYHVPMGNYPLGKGAALKK